jgi:uncharacterized repeat protein (TIGR01451 family)
VTSGGTATMIGATVAANSASTGGGLDNAGGTVKLGNTIVAANAASGGPDALGSVISLGTNLVGEDDGSLGWAGSDLTGTVAQPLNALLAPLGSYGGPTQTMALLPGSPAINGGNNALIPTGVTTDQRGLARIVGGTVDIGAFESKLFTIAVTSGSGQSTAILTGFPAPLVATVTANNPMEPVAGGLVTFRPPATGASAVLAGNPATIATDGTVAVVAAANGDVGRYTIPAGANGITNTAVFTLTNQAVPTITTTPNVSAVTLGTSPVILKDTAVLAQGYFETGTITFTLYLGNTLLDTETVAVNGDGAYTTSTGYTLPTSGTVTGTYQWNATYTGDPFNLPATENNATAERTVVSPANPSIVTTSSAPAVALGISPVTLTDTATLSGGYCQGGTITFTLYFGSTLVDTETVPVTGNGTYSTPTGYTLPTTGTVTGTYQWDASYSGDTNNSPASESDAQSEQTVVSPAGPSIVTTSSAASLTLGTTAPTLKDTAVLSGGYYETGTVTFSLYLGDTLVDTESLSVDGNGTYTTPTGYTLPTTGTVTGTYQWDVSFSGDTNNNPVGESNAAAERTVVSAASAMIATTPSAPAMTLGTSAVTLKDTAVLSGGYYETGTITFTLYLGNTLVDTETVAVNGNGTYTAPVGYTLPTTGAVIGTYQWDATYNGDTNNNAAPDPGDVVERTAVSPANPTITTMSSTAATTLGTSAPTLKDTATLSGGYHETGTLTFMLYLGNTLVDTETVPVLGNGSYTTPTGYTLPTTGSVVGTYQWNASFSGDSNNNAAGESAMAGERTAVSPASPAITTTPSPNGATSGTAAVTLLDTAQLSGGYYPTGTITFTLVAPGGATVDTETIVVNGNGSYTTPAGYALPSTASGGIYQWNATYSSGSGNNPAVSDINNSNEQVIVAIPNLTVTKTADMSTVTAVQNIGFTVTITNTGTVATTNVALSDLLPAGAGGDVNWTIDAYKGSPADFAITGSVGNQSLVLSSYFINTLGDSLAPGQSISAHITSPTDAADGNYGTPTTGFDSTGTVAAGVVTLGTANNYGVLGLRGTAINNSLVTIHGNEGVSQNGSLTNMAPSTVTGNVYEYASGQYSGPGTVGGSIIASPTLLAQNDADALNASAAAKGLAATQTFSTISSPTTVMGNGSLNVIAINGNITASLILKGTANDVFIVNVTGTVTLGGNSELGIGGSVTPNHVLYNFTGSSGTITSHVGNMFYGTLLGPSYSFNLDGSFIGEIIGGGSSIALLSGATVNAGSMVSNTATVSATGVTPRAASAKITIVPDSVTVAGTVYCDTNLNGVFDSNEEGEAGATVTLSGTTNDGTIVSLTAQTVGGAYQFDNLPPGTYTVSLATPNSGDVFESSHGSVVISESQTLDLTAGGASFDNNFPEIDYPASVGGLVFIDINDSGSFDSGDQALSGATVKLTGKNYLGQAVSLTTTSTSAITNNANYSFSNLLPSDGSGYTVTVTPPSGFLNGTDIVGNLGGTTTQNSGIISVIVLSGCNNVATGYDFGQMGISHGLTATIGFWNNQNGQALLNSLGTTSSGQTLANWLAASFPNLFGKNAPAFNVNSTIGTNLTNQSDSNVASYFVSLFNAGSMKPYAQVLATAFAVFTTTNSLDTGTTSRALATKFGFTLTNGGAGSATYTVPQADWAAFGITSSSGATQTITQLLLGANKYAIKGMLSGGNATLITEANDVFNAINNLGDIGYTVTNASLSGSGQAYSPADVLTAYGLTDVSLDGTGQTIAIVGAYDDPSIFQALDTFDAQFGLASGMTLYEQFGVASSFLAVLNQSGQAGSLPSVDPNGPGTANWETEEALDVEWVHAIAPGARIVLVEANSQALSDLMAAVGTAAAQPGVSVVSMSWGLPEGQSVFAADEASYDSVFDVPGVTFLASTGDYGVADPEYPAFSPNVVAVGGTSLTLNADNSYNSETGWGYYSDAAGTSIGSGGGISQYEAEPSFQRGVQSTGYRTTPDVSTVADPATGVWIADPYNLDPSKPFEAVGGTSLAAPIWAGLLAMVNQGRAAAGQAALNSSGPSETLQALYSLPQSDYNSITSGSNGYTANAGYNLVTGLGTPIAGSLVPDLVAYHGSGTTYAGPTVGPLQDATLSGSWTAGSGTENVFSVFNAIPAGHFGFATRYHGMATTQTAGQMSNSPEGPVSTPEAPQARPFSPSLIGSVATGSDTGPIGIVPTSDAQAAHDTVLAGWSSSPKRAAVRPVEVIVPGVASPSRTSVLQGELVDSALEGFGALPFLLGTGDQTQPGPLGKPRRLIV